MRLCCGVLLLLEQGSEFLERVLQVRVLLREGLAADLDAAALYLQEMVDQTTRLASEGLAAKLAIGRVESAPLVAL